MTDMRRSADPKAESRRQQVVDAASICARRLHGAGLAEIAQAAALSVGQIRRDFGGKKAIGAGDVAETHDESSELERSGEPLARGARPLATDQ